MSEEKVNTPGSPKAYLYIRVGTAAQLDGDAKLQEKQLRDYAEAAGYSVVGKSVITGTSADSLPELERLAIDREYRGDAQVILATNPSRLSRDMNSLFGVTKALSLANIHLAFADGTGDLSERLQLLSALHVEDPAAEESSDYEELLDPDDAELPFQQTM